MPVQSRPPAADRAHYERAAQEFYDLLPLEHFMESTPQQTQRKIALASFDLIHAALPTVWCYNELLIQYPHADIPLALGRVVPDNLVVIHRGEINGTGSFNTPHEQARLFLAMEYVTPASAYKDTVENVPKYDALAMPYYLIFHTDQRAIQLMRRSPKVKRLRNVRPNTAGRYDIPKLELEVGMYDHWMRFWFRGRMLPLPAELDEQLAHANEKLKETEAALRTSERSRRAAEERARASERAREAAEAEIAALRAELDQLKKSK